MPKGVRLQPNILLGQSPPAGGPRPLACPPHPCSLSTMVRRAAVLVLAVALSACIREPELPPPPPPPPVPPTPGLYYEEDLQPDPTVRIEIIDLGDEVDRERNRVTVTGTLINRGTKATSQVSVKLHALDEQGDTLLSVAAVPSTDRIPANGGRARFTAEFDHNPAIRSYHVEALAR